MSIRLALAAAVLGLVAVSGAAQAAVLAYQTTLSGAAEAPPNASPGTGSARLVVDTLAQTYTLDVDFQDLLSAVTVAHVHGPTSVPFAGTAGVMTTTPSFPDFPSGVTSGTYSRSFDLTEAATFNPAFVTASGGVSGAGASFLAALAGGQAYLNVHSTAFGAGEIRGFFAPAPIPLPAGAVLVLSALAALGGLRLARPARRAA